MTEIEYEYSFKVEDISPYLTYCEEHGFEKKDESIQVRKLYRNDSGVMARLTTKCQGENTTTTLDFKDDNDSEEVLKECRETIPMEVTSENQDAITSILNIFNYQKKKVLNRTRVNYRKGNVLFEIDQYTSPEVMGVVAIEGNKKEVDQVYSELMNIIKNREVKTDDTDL